MTETGPDAQPEAEEHSLRQRVTELTTKLGLTDWLVVVLTAVIAGATAWNTIYVGDQLSEMRSAGVDTKNLVTATANLARAAQHQADDAAKLRKATEDFAKAMDTQASNTANLVKYAGKSADFANTSAGAAEGQLQALQVGQRAFMNAVGVELQPITIYGQTGGYWLTFVNWTNSGNTPTRDLTIKTDCYVSSKPFADPYQIPPTDPFYSKPRPWSASHRYVFGPRQSSHAGVCPATWMDVVFSEISRDFTLYVVGRAEYRDVLKPKSVHLTEFCFQLNDFSDAPKPATTPGYLTSLCMSYNCADDECSKPDREQAARDLAESHY